jgi:tRNA modification GTPase
MKRVVELAQSFVPAGDEIALNRRQAAHLTQAASALERGVGSNEIVLLADDLRVAREALDRLTGRAGVEDVLDALFARFCLGK